MPQHLRSFVPPIQVLTCTNRTVAVNGNHDEVRFPERSPLSHTPTPRGTELRAFLERHVLPNVQTPAQYLGGELNQIVKDHAMAKIKVALAFPDTYAMGMSSIGLKILYHVWNEQPGCLNRCC